MSASESYAARLRDRGNALLREYIQFLSLFDSKLSEDEAPLEEYRRWDMAWRKRFASLDKTLRAFDAAKKYPYDSELLKSCRSYQDQVILSLERGQSRLTHEIQSLNRTNSRLGLRYNRYRTTASAAPEFIDIRT